MTLFALKPIVINELCFRALLHLSINRFVRRLQRFGRCCPERASCTKCSMYWLAHSTFMRSYSQYTHYMIKAASNSSIFWRKVFRVRSVCSLMLWMVAWRSKLWEAWNPGWLSRFRSSRSYFKETHLCPLWVEAKSTKVLIILLGAVQESLVQKNMFSADESIINLYYQKFNGWLFGLAIIAWLIYMMFTLN
jgi:hypothetical protein